MSLFANSKYGPVEYRVFTHYADVGSLTVEVNFIVTGTATGDVGEEALLKHAIRQMEKLMDGRLEAARKDK